MRFEKKASANFWNAEIFGFLACNRRNLVWLFYDFRTAIGAFLGRMIWVFFFRMGVIKRSWFPKRKDLGVSIAHQYAVMGGLFEIYRRRDCTTIGDARPRVGVERKGRAIGTVKLASWVYLSIADKVT